MSVNKCVFNNGSNISTLADFIEVGNAPALEKFTTMTIDKTKMWNTNDYWLTAVHKEITNWQFGFTSGNTTYTQDVAEGVVGVPYYTNGNLRFELHRSNQLTATDTFIDIDGGDTGGFGILNINNDTVTDFLLEAVSDDFIVAFFKGYTSSDAKTCYCFYNNGSTVRKANMLSTLQSYTAQRKALGNTYAEEYSAQPVIMFGRKTPIYSIVRNTADSSPAIYSEVVIAGQKFFIIDNDFGIKC